MASSVAAVAEKALATIQAAFNALNSPDGSGVSQLFARSFGLECMLAAANVCNAMPSSHPALCVTSQVHIIQG